MRSRVIDKSRAAKVGAIVPGCDLVGLSAGDFSFVELIEHVLGESQDCDVVVSAWTAAAQDIERVATWRHNVRLILDTGFVFCKPDAKDSARRLFRDDQMRFVKTHCKFALIRRDGMNLVIRSSMNLNHNPKIESYSITDCAEMHAHFSQLVDAIFADCAKFDEVRPGDLVRANDRLYNLLGPARGIDSMSYCGEFTNVESERISYA